MVLPLILLFQLVGLVPWLAFWLAIAGLTSENSQTVVSGYLSMDMISWFVIIPACFGTLLTGLIGHALGPLPVPLSLNSYMADLVSGATLSDSDFRGLRIQLIADAGVALLILLVATSLSVYKPGV